MVIVPGTVPNFLHTNGNLWTVGTCRNLPQPTNYGSFAQMLLNAIIIRFLQM
jgi:hypothetical protein